MLFGNTLPAYFIEDNSGDGSSDDHSIVAENGYVNGVEQSICMTSHELDDMQVAPKDSQREKGDQLLQKFSQNRRLDHHSSEANAIICLLCCYYTCNSLLYIVTLRLIDDTFSE